MKNQTLYFKLGEASKSWVKRAKNKSSRPPYWQSVLIKKGGLSFTEKVPRYVQKIQVGNTVKHILHY